VTPRTVLDAAAFDVVDAAGCGGVRALLRQSLAAGGKVCCAAVTLSGACRGSAITRRAEVAISRDRGGQRIRVVPTDERLAKLVGAILHQRAAGSELLADAHVVAAGAGASSAIVLTSDADDIADLAAAVPGTRTVIRDPCRR